MSRTARLFLTLAFTAASAAITAAPAAQEARRPDRTGPAVRTVSTAWLAAAHDPALVLLHVSMPDEFAGGHLPGARELPYDAIVVRRDSLSSELPAADSLRSLFERLGVSDGSTVVVYAHQGPMATRAILTLAYLGLDDVALLDGGLPQWRAEGRPLATGSAAAAMANVARGRITAAPQPDLVVTADWIAPRTARPGLSLVDTRTDGEYLGTGNRSGMPSAGHLAGAHQLQWEELFREGSPTHLRPREELARLFAERVRPEDVVVTYCWVGYRASATWFVARLLGYDARLYDGSYQDWQRRGLPVRAGAKP